MSVFDKGRRVGGRASTRRDAEGRLFDHGAQYFTATDAAFRREVARWVEAGTASLWDARLAAIDCDARGCVRSTPPAAKERYVGVPGMSAVAESLAAEIVSAGVDVISGVEVVSLRRQQGAWKVVLSSETPEERHFAAVLVTAPAPQAAELLAPSPAMANAARGVRLAPCWAVMASVAGGALEVDFDAAFVNGGPESIPLSWVARDGSKPGRPSASQAGDCWVLHGSPAWSAQNIELPADEVVAALLSAFWRVADLPLQTPASAVGHRWRFALPENPLAETFLADHSRGLFAAGDWCGGPRVEGAYLSGLAAADEIFARV